MKNGCFYCWILFIGFLVGMLSGCQKITDDIKEDSMQSADQFVTTVDSNIESENMVNNSKESSNMGGTDISETLNTNVSLELAKDTFSTITSISQEWQDGLFVVNGVDMFENKICGIMNKKGEIELYDEYSVLYPLEGDYLIASTDEELMGDISTEWKGITGKIINKNKDVMYEPSEEEPFQRMYIINSTHILVLSAEAGFDGVNVKWGMMNYDGKWIHPLEKFENLEVEDYMKQMIKMGKDGRIWSLKIEMTRSRGEEGSDSKALRVRMYIQGKERDLIYWTGDEKFVEYDLSEFYETGSTVYEFGENRLLFPTRTDTLKNHYGFFYKDGNTEDLDLGSANIFAVIKDNVYLSYSIEGIIHIYDSDDNEIIFPDNFIDRYRSKKIYNRVFFFLLKGADNNEYMASTDLEGNLIVEPFLIQGSVEHWDIQGDYLVYTESYFPDQSVALLDSDIYIVNYDTKENIVITKKFESIDGVMFLNEELFAIYWKEKDVKHYEVYDILGNRIS